MDCPSKPLAVRRGNVYNHYVDCSHYSPLVASIAETGDMVGGLLRKGNSGNATRADQWIPTPVQCIRQTTGADALGAANIPFVGGHCQPCHAGKNGLAIPETSDRKAMGKTG